MTKNPRARKPTPKKPAPTIRGTAREAILVATLEVLAVDGIDAVTHRRVAECAGVSPGSTTHHFASRTELIREAFRYYMAQADRLFMALSGPSGGDPVERVARRLDALVAHEFTDPRLVRAEYELLLFASTDPELAIDVAGWEARMVAGLAAALETTGTPTPFEAARTLLNFVRGYELERLINPELPHETFGQRLGPLLAALCNRNDASGPRNGPDT